MLDQQKTPTAASSLYTEDDICRLKGREEGDFQRMLRAAQLGDRAFIAKRTRMGNAVIMSGSEAHGWERGMVCYGHDYSERAVEFVRRFNTRAAKLHA